MKVRSVASVLLPAKDRIGAAALFGRDAARQDAQGLAGMLSGALRGLILLFLPVTVGLMVLREPIDGHANRAIDLVLVLVDAGGHEKVLVHVQPDEAGRSFLVCHHINPRFLWMPAHPAGLGQAHPFEGRDFTHGFELAPNRMSPS